MNSQTLANILITVCHINLLLTCICTLQGEFFSIFNHQEAPFTPNPLPAVNDTGKMMYVWLTEYMADTAGFVYQQAGQLNYNVTPSMVS